jgi:hypothetical protein
VKQGGAELVRPVEEIAAAVAELVGTYALR